MTQTTTKPTPVLDAVKARRTVHVVPVQPDGTPADQALCGYLWDVIGEHLAGPVCQECREQAARLGLVW